MRVDLKRIQHLNDLVNRILAYHSHRGMQRLVLRLQQLQVLVRVMTHICKLNQFLHLLRCQKQLVELLLHCAVYRVLNADQQLLDLAVLQLGQGLVLE